MASNLSFDSFGFLFGPSLVGANGFLKSQDVYLGSAFGTSAPYDHGGSNGLSNASKLRCVVVGCGKGRCLYNAPCGIRIN